MKETTKEAFKDRLSLLGNPAKHPQVAEILNYYRSMSSMRILRLPTARAKTGQASSTFWAAVKKKELPPPIAISARSVGWIESELDAVIAVRLFASRSGEAIDMVEFVRALTEPRRNPQRAPSSLST